MLYHSLGHHMLYTKISKIQFSPIYQVWENLFNDKIVKHLIVIELKQGH